MGIWNPGPGPTDGDDLYTGDETRETIEGGGGNDTLFGGGAVDVIYGGDGNDWIDAGSGEDFAQVIYTGAGNDTVVMNYANVGETDVRDFQAGDKIDISALGIVDFDTAKMLRFMSDINLRVIYDSQSVEFTIRGQFSLAAENFTYATQSNDLTLVGGAGVDFMFGGFGDDQLSGSLNNDKLGGGPGSDLLLGGDGNDTLHGGFGADTMQGGVGDDTYYLDNAGDVFTELAGQGNDLVYTTFSYVVPDVIERAALLGSEHLNLTGNATANLLLGNSGNNILDGKAGADTMRGGDGDDTYYVDVFHDVVEDFVGYNTVYTSVNINGSAFEKVVLLDGATRGQARREIIGNAADNDLAAMTMIGGAGNDYYRPLHVYAVIVEQAGEGIDTVFSPDGFVLPANVENLYFGKNSGVGNDLANIITTADGNQTLDGGAGADTLTGERGNDVYIVDNIGDVVVEAANAGLDRVRSTISYTLASNVEILELQGGANIDATGNSLDNILTGNSGNNVLDGGSGDDTMSGGLGDDIYVVDTDNRDSTFLADVTIELAGEGVDTVRASGNWVLSANIENLELTGSLHLLATGNDLANVIVGNDGANTINGGAGADSMYGGLGDDLYDVDNVGDVVGESAVGGVDGVRSSVSWSMSSNVENLRLTGGAAVAATGNGLANLITGNFNSNTLDGGGGNDTLNGSDGADVMLGRAGNDVFYVENAADIVTESANDGRDLVVATINYTLTANVEDLTLGGAEALNGNGNALANVIRGNDGNNILDGGAGADTMSGGKGHDYYYVDNVGDVTAEAGGATYGTDTIRSTITWSMASNIEKLVLAGGANRNGVGNGLGNEITGNGGANVLSGATGNDTLSGASGDDRLIGGIGQDVLTGGFGADAFVFDAPRVATNTDTVTDFDVADDIIHLDNAIFTQLGVEGALNAGMFRIGSGPADANDFLFYNATTGALYYDANANAAGGAFRIATLAPGLALTAADFLVI